MEFSGRRFKSHSGQVSIATSKDTQVVKTYVSVESTRLMWLPQKFDWSKWRLTKTMAEIKSRNEETIKLEWLYKVATKCELNSRPDSSVG